MLNFLFGVFLVLHGLVHLLYVVLSRGLVKNEPEIAWTGRSWVFTNLLGQSVTLLLASVSYMLATVVFVVGGVGVLFNAGWWHGVIVGSAALSSVVILLFWDGDTRRVVDKGLLGLLINVAILVALLVFKWPAGGF